MRRILAIWVGLGLIYATFLYWHLPLAPALAPDEWRKAAQDARLDTRELPPAFPAFFDGDDGRPFLMINILDHAQSAEYPAGQFPEITDAAKAARIYGSGVIPELLVRGSYPLLQATRISILLDDIPAQTDRFETFAVVRYRSRRDFLDLILDPDFQGLTVHKWASLDGTIVIPAHLVLASNLTLWVPVGLMGLGLALMAWRRS